jgi:hypothetical protein
VGLKAVALLALAIYLLSLQVALRRPGRELPKAP